MFEIKKTEEALQFEKIHNVDFTPKRATEGSNGFDLTACTDVPLTIYPDEVVKIGTGICIWLGATPMGYSDELYAGLLLPRSSTKGAILNNTVGLIDSDYQGEIFVKLRNVTNEPITIAPFERFAQLVIIPTYVVTPKIVDTFSKVTARGEGSFGSTGK